MKQCEKCGQLIPAQMELCDDCFTRWIRNLLIFSALAVLVLVSLATAGSR